MAYVLRGPLVSGAGDCLSCCWHANSTRPCADTLRISSSSNGGLVTFSLNFAGRGKVGGYCGGSDSYVTFSGQGTATAVATVDIWQAYIDGVWSSSTTVLLYQAAVPNVNTGTVARPSDNALSSCGPGIANSFDLDGGLCATLLTATVTITDDGAIGLA